MPQVAAGAVLAGVASYATGATVLGLSVLSSAFLNAGISLVLGGVSHALTPKPKGIRGSIDTKPGTVAVRQSDLTRTYIYGHTRAIRGYAHMESTNDNRDLHMIIILGEGPLRAINEVWLNDYCIPPDDIDANGNVIAGRYSGYLTIRKHLGNASQAADSLAVSNMSAWTSNHRLQGIAYLYVIMNKNQDVYPTGVPNVSAIVEGPALFDPRVEAIRWTTNIAQFARDYITDQKGFESTEDDINDVNISAQMNICDEIVATTTENFNVSLVVPSTDIITLNGDILTLQYGDRVQISSTLTLPGGLSALTDYYVIPYQIKDNPRIRLAATFDDSMAATAIDITSTGSGIITVTKTGEPRYHGSGVIDSNTNLSENLNNMVNSMAGRAVNIAGAWTLFAGAWRTPDLNFTIGDIRGSGVNFKNCLSMSESYNEIKGLFSGAPTLYQDTDYPRANYPAFIEQDLGRVQTKELNLLFTSRPTTAQRIAKIELFRGRQDIVVSCDLSMKALQVQPGDNIGLTIDRYGWEDKIFEITSFDFDISENGILAKVGIRETAQAIFDWSAGEAIDFDPAPNTNLTNPFLVQVVAGVKYNSTFIDTRDGDAVYTIQLLWDLHPDAFVREYGDFEIQFKLSADTEWRPSFFVAGALTFTDVVTASVGTYYDIRIRARNNLGVRSGWSTLLEVIVGSSGGVTDTDDWELVTDPISIYKDWAGVSDTISAYEDWGFVV